MSGFINCKVAYHHHRQAGIIKHPAVKYRVVVIYSLIGADIYSVWAVALRYYAINRKVWQAGGDIRPGGAEIRGIKYLVTRRIS